MGYLRKPYRRYELANAVARALRVTFRRTDVVSRIGGTLFAVLALAACKPAPLE